MTEEEYYAGIKAEYEASTDAKLVEWARPYFEGTKKPNSKDRYVVCPVSERAARDIFELTGIDVHGYSQVLRCDIIRHVDKRHGKKGRADTTIQDISDIGRLKYVIDNYDYMTTDNKPVFGFNDKNGNAAIAIKYVKRINGYVITAETAMDVPKSKTLYILSMYKAKTPDFLAQKRESTDHCNTTAIPHARSEVDSVTSILPQLEKNVKPVEKDNFMAQKRELAATAQSEPSPYVRNDANSITSILPQSEKDVKPLGESNSVGLRNRYSENVEKPSQKQRPMSAIEKIVRECHGVKPYNKGGKKPPDRGNSGR